MSKSNGGKTTYVPTEFQFYAPKEKQTFGQFFYNSKDGTYFGRTPKSWGQLMLFYGIFYIVLAALFTICMQGLLSTLKETEPKWKLENSLIGTNPGLGFRPLSEETERGSLIKYDHAKKGENDYWIGLLDNFMQQYNTSGNGADCSFNSTHKPNDVCKVNINQFGPCSPEKGYGFKDGKPCVFLKLNKIFNWIPQYYDNPKDLPENMPTELQNHIKSVENLKLQQIWVSCDGSNAQDQERMENTTISYYPNQGFPAYYYPYLNQPGYLSPLIAVQFAKLPNSTMVNIECRAWAKNILYSGSIRDRKGSVAFQLIVD